MSTLPLPTAVLNYGLSGDAFYLYVQLLTLVETEDGLTQEVTQQQLAERIGLAHRNGLRHPLEILHAAGLVYWQRGAAGQGARRYLVVLDPPVRQSPKPNALHGVHKLNAPNGVHLGAVNAPNGVHKANAPIGVHKARGQQIPTFADHGVEVGGDVNAPNGVHYNPTTSIVGIGSVPVNSLDLTGINEPVTATTGVSNPVQSKEPGKANTGTGGTGNTHARKKPKKLLAKEKAKIRYNLPDLSQAAQDALQYWRELQGKDRVPVLNRLLAEDLENSVATIHHTVLEEAAKWAARNQVAEIIKWLRAARRIVREGGTDAEGRYVESQRNGVGGRNASQVIRRQYEEETPGVARPASRGIMGVDTSRRVGRRG